MYNTQIYSEVNGGISRAGVADSNTYGLGKYRKCAYWLAIIIEW